LKVTVPVGVPDPGAFAVTVAVNVTGCPYTDGFTELTSVLVVLSLFTVCDSVPEVLPEKLPSPPYRAVTRCIPPLRLEVVNVALSLAFSIPVPRVVPPSWKVTVPVGVPPEPVMVAVNVTAWPKTEALSELASAVVELFNDDTV
jgi:hypothetical protein